MAEENDQERHLPASQKRLDEARERGQVPRSREVNTAALLLAGAALIAWSGPEQVRDAAAFFGEGLTLTRAGAFDTAYALQHSGVLLARGFWVFAPLLLTLMAVALIAPLALGGWLFSSQALAPDFSRLDPLRGLSNLISGHSAGELLKAFGKASLIGGAALWLLWSDRAGLTGLTGMAPAAALAAAGELVTHDFLLLAAALLLIAAADVPWQIWRHGHGLRMSQDEVKRESKETEGDPMIKSRIRQRQREAARRRMMSAVPKADVVVTNPTHYAVALSYQAGAARAPRVVAKGRDEVAARIRALAEEHGVPLLEAPPLARALYTHTELEQEIPAALYNAVAQVLAYVFQLRAAPAGRQPAAPQDIPVPAELDPNTAPAAPAAAASITGVAA